MILDAGFEVSGNKNHGKVLDGIKFVRGLSDKIVIIPMSNLHSRTYRDLITELSHYIREHYNEEIARSRSRNYQV